MNAELIESREMMSFHLDGESEIDAALLSKMISDMAELTKITAREVNPDAYLKMNVTAFKNGSFQVDFSAVCQVAESLINTLAPGVTLAATVIGGVKGIFEIKKFLKGEKAKSVTEPEDGYITVESKTGQKITVPAQSGIVMNVVQADQLVTNISEGAREHNPDGGFSLTVKDESVVCSSEDVSNMAKPLPINETVTCQRFRADVTMRIRKAVLEGTSKWGFDLNGKAIEASIADDNFLEVFQHNGRVGKGDYIEATIEIYVDLDLQGHPVRGTEKYTVIQVHGDIKHENEEGEQENLF